MAPTVKTSAQGLQITVGKGAVNVSFTVEGFSEFVSDSTFSPYFKYTSIYVDYPGSCYNKETVKATGSLVLTSKVECVVVGPVTENATYEVFVQGRTYYDENSLKKIVSSSDKDTVKLVVK